MYFTDKYSITYNRNQPFPEALTILPKTNNDIGSIVYRDSKLSNVHIVVGKTGAGKTNIFQLIGMPEEERINNAEPDDSYFLLYKEKDSFFVELLNTRVDDAFLPDSPLAQIDVEINKMPNRIKKLMNLYNSMFMYRFKVNKSGQITDLKHINISQLTDDLTYFFNGYERYAFAACPYEDIHSFSVKTDTEWQPRMNAEYHRTALWNSCRFLREYIASFDKDNIKRKAALVIRSSNWSDTIKQHISENLENHDYWTYVARKQKAEEKLFLGEQVKEKQLPETKHQFIHDFLTDYALYLRKWISYILMFPSGKIDASQEFSYYYSDKIEEEKTRKAKKKRGNGKKRKWRRKVTIQPTVLPDFENISILKRLEWLCEWIDLHGENDAHSILYQIFNDIKDIRDILKQFDNKYFTNDTFTLPIEDMYLAKNKQLVEDLFECMEQYHPDDTGIFTKELLPYHFSCISSGEYQYAKVLGGIEEYCVKLSVGNTYGNHPNLIYLLDEPETYMHPELCRTFLKRLDDLIREREGSNDIQVLISTHSPMLLSDMLPAQVTRLDCDTKGYCIIKNENEKTYFGANIHTILADGFFLDYTIGEYARDYLQRRFEALKEIIEKENVTEDDKVFVREMDTIVPVIGDDLIRNSFQLLIKMLEDKL